MILFPRLQKLLATETSYQIRVAAVYAFGSLAEARPKDLLPICVQEAAATCKDRVPNVRLVSLKVLQTCISKADDSSRLAAKSAAQALGQDADADVRQLAQAVAAL